MLGLFPYLEYAVPFKLFLFRRLLLDRKSIYLGKVDHKRTFRGAWAGVPAAAGLSIYTYGGFCWFHLIGQVAPAYEEIHHAFHCGRVETQFFT
jgi:hypothetical protein